MKITRASYPGIRIGTPLGFSIAFRLPGSSDQQIGIGNGCTKIPTSTNGIIDTAGRSQQWIGTFSSEEFQSRTGIFSSRINQSGIAQSEETLSHTHQPAFAQIKPKFLCSANLFWRWNVLRTNQLQSILLRSRAIRLSAPMGVRVRFCPPREEYSLV